MYVTKIPKCRVVFLLMWGAKADGYEPEAE